MHMQRSPNVSHKYHKIYQPCIVFTRSSERRNIANVDKATISKALQWCVTGHRHNNARNSD